MALATKGRAGCSAARQAISRWTRPRKRPWISTRRCRPIEQRAGVVGRGQAMSARRQDQGRPNPTIVRSTFVRKTRRRKRPGPVGGKGRLSFLEPLLISAGRRGTSDSPPTARLRHRRMLAWLVTSARRSSGRSAGCRPAASGGRDRLRNWRRRRPRCDPDRAARPPAVGHRDTAAAAGEASRGRDAWVSFRGVSIRGVSGARTTSGVRGDCHRSGQALDRSGAARSLASRRSSARKRSHRRCGDRRSRDGQRSRAGLTAWHRRRQHDPHLFAPVGRMARWDARGLGPAHRRISRRPLASACGFSTTVGRSAAVFS